MGYRATQKCFAVVCAALLFLFTASSADAITAAGNGNNLPFQNSAGPAPAVSCDKSQSVNITTATTTQIVAISGTTVIYVCGFTFDKSSAAGTAFQFVYGTGASCATGQAILTAAMDGPAAWAVSGSGLGTIFRTAAAQALCITSTGAIGLQGFVTYSQF